MLGIFAFGALVGFWYGASIDNAPEYMEESPNIYIQIASENRGAFGFFVSSFFIVAIATALIFLFSCHPIASYLTTLIPLYFGYCLGFEIIIMFKVCGISAIILVILGILIYRLGCGAIFSVLSVWIIEQASCFASKKENLKISLMFLIVTTAFIIIMSILIPFGCKLLAYS